MWNLLPERAATFAADIDRIISLISWTVGIWLIAAYAVFFAFLVLFRRRPGVASRYVPGTGRQMAWVLVPVALVFVCDVAIDNLNTPVWEQVKETLPASGDTIRIVGRQWMWEFTYPGPDGKFDTADDVKTVNELHVRVNVPTRFELTATDVLHSFSVPAFRIKQDAVPGRRISGWFEADKTGSYDIQCTQICGLGHSQMAARVTVESAGDFARFLTRTAGLNRAPAAQAISSNFESVRARN